VSGVGRYAFPVDLFAAGNFISQLMTNFALFRAKGVEITLKLSSTPYYQGALMVGWVPDTTNVSPSPNIMQLSATPNVILSASKQDSAVVTIPWLSAVDYCKLTEANPQEIGTLYILPLVSLVPPTGATSSLELTIFAKFVEPEVAGYTKQSTNKQRFNSEASKKDQSGLDAPSIVSSVSKVARKVPIIGDIWSPIADVLNTVAGDLSKPTSNQALTKTLMNSSENYSFVSGEFFGNPLSMYPNAQVEQGRTMYGMETSHMTVAELARRPMLFDFWTLNSVTPTWSTQVDIFGQATIIDVEDYGRFVARAHARWRGSTKYLFYFCCNAFHAAKVRFSLTYGSRAGLARSEDIPYQIVDIKGDTWHAITVPYLRQFAWTHVSHTSDAPTLTMHLESAITGDNLPATPTIYVCVFKSCGEDVQFSRLGNANKTSPSDSKKTNSTETIVTKRQHINVEYTKQTSVQERFRSAFPPIVPGCMFATERGFCVSETTDTVSDCMKRFGLVNPKLHAGINYFSTPELTATVADAVNKEPYHYFTTLFKYWRGSRRLVRLDSSSGKWAGVILRPLNTYGGESDFLVAGWGVVPYQSTTTRDAFEIPWYADLPYAPVDRFPTAYPGYPDDIISPSDYPLDATNYLVAGGDDFVGLHPMWPVQV
jgi:hypothetical protein